MEALGNLIKAVTPGVGKVANVMGDVAEEVTDVNMPNYAYGYIPFIIIVIISIIITYSAITTPDDTVEKSDDTVEKSDNTVKKSDNTVKKSDKKSKLSMLIKSWKTILISLGFSMLCGAIVGFFVWKGVWYIMNPHIMGLSMAKQAFVS